MDFPKRVIKIGDTDGIVLSLVKNRLNELGYGPLTPKIANFGESTEKAVKAFQYDNNLVRDGEIGELTWEKLFTAPKKSIIELRSDVLRIRALGHNLSQLGVREKTNHNDGIEVEAYLKSVGLAKGNPYCQAGQYWCHKNAAHDLNVPTLMPQTGGVLDCWSKVKKYRVSTPDKGDQFFMDFGQGKGHTGMVVKVTTSGRLHTVEFNTTFDPTTPEEDRNGGKNGGCFERNRSMKSILGYARYM